LVDRAGIAAETVNDAFLAERVSVDSAVANCAGHLDAAVTAVMNAARNHGGAPTALTMSTLEAAVDQLRGDAYDAAGVSSDPRQTMLCLENRVFAISVFELQPSTAP
jgi:hypothetical protein